jgi:hypothetical protein
MVKFSAAAGVAGLWFLIWQLWRQQRAAKSLETYAFESSGAAANLATPLEATRIAREANAPPARFLSVNTFDFKNLEVRGSAAVAGGSGDGDGRLPHGGAGRANVARGHTHPRGTRHQDSSSRRGTAHLLCALGPALPPLPPIRRLSAGQAGTQELLSGARALQCCCTRPGAPRAPPAASPACGATTHGRRRSGSRQATHDRDLSGSREDVRSNDIILQTAGLVRTGAHRVCADLHFIYASGCCVCGAARQGRER